MTLRLLIPALVALCLAALADVNSARAGDCPSSPISGTWVNPQAQTHDLVRLELIPECDARRPGLMIWNVLAWGKCIPRDCRWGSRIAASRDPARVLVKFDTFIAERFVKIVSAGYAVRVTYLIDYRSDDRKDERGELEMLPPD